MLFMPTFRVFDYALHWRIPRYTAWLDACDMRPAYREYRRTLGVLGAQFPGTAVMKGPSHLHALDALLEVVPEARVVWTHRDPVKAVASFGSLSAVHHRTMYGSFDPVETGRRTLARFSGAVARGTEALDRLGTDRVTHVAYPDLAADPLGTVARLAERWGVAYDEGAARAALTSLPRLPRHDYDAARWGLSEGEMREAFRGYTERFDVRPEA